MEPIRTLLERQQPATVPALPENLRVLYGGDLLFPGAGERRPYVIGNFVSTLDGVVSFETPGRSGGGNISGFNPGDLFIMGLLRSSADAVMVGAGTLREVSSSHLWTAEYISPAAAGLYTHYRQTLHKPRYPLTVIVSASGDIDLEKAPFHTPDVTVVIITTDEGKERLLAAGAGSLASTEVRVNPAFGSTLAAAAILDLLWREFGARLLLHEGGPLLFGSFVAQGLVDEYFLTIAPQLAGRSAEGWRPGMVGGVEFPPENAPWLELLSVKQSADHLYLRYRKRDQPR